MNRLAALFVFGVTAAAFAASDAELQALVDADMLHPVRPGGVDGRAFWNVHSRLAMYPPAFDFKTVDGAVKYRFTVTDDVLKEHSFESGRPTADLSPVWRDVPEGYVLVTAEGIDSQGGICGLAGKRRFWRLAPYTPGAYPADVPWSYAESARRCLETVFNHPNTVHFLKHGKPDGVSELENIYPSKMNAALICGMLRFAELNPSKKADAYKVAVNAADFMIAESQPPSAPLAGLPPTYRQIKNQGPNNIKSIKYAGQNMMSYPAVMGDAYLKLYAAVKERRHLEAALAIARTYERWQLPEGTWYIKMWEKDASAVIEGNGAVPVRLIPTPVIAFMDELAAVTGDSRWRKIADKAMMFIDNGPLKTWDWAAQFEDTTPSAHYRDMSSDPTCDIALVILRRCPGNKKRIAQVRELLRWSEDQFVCWKRPCRPGGWGLLSEPSDRIYNPTWNGQYPGNSFNNWIDVPCSTEKYRWFMGIGGKTAKVAMLFAKMYELEGNPLDLAKAKTLCDAIVRVQAMNGGYIVPTHWRVRDLTGGKCTANWTNCTIFTAVGLEYVSTVAGRE